MNTQLLTKSFETRPNSFDGDSYVIRLLETSDIDMLVQLLVDRFLNQSPFNKAYYEKTSEKASKFYSSKTDLQRSRWRIFAGEFISNKVSVGCFLKENGELVGVSAVIRFGYAPPQMSQLMDDINYNSAVFRLEKELLSQVSPKYHQILSEKHKIIDITGVAIKENHTGKGLLPKMMLRNQQLASEQGYEYSFCFAVNIKTIAALRKLGYEKMSEGDAWEFQQNGVRYFQKVEQMNRMSASLWIKKICTTSKLQ